MTSHFHVDAEGTLQQPFHHPEQGLAVGASGMNQFRLLLPASNFLHHGQMRCVCCALLSCITENILSPFSTSSSILSRAAAHSGGLRKELRPVPIDKALQAGHHLLLVLLVAAPYAAAVYVAQLDEPGNRQVRHLLLNLKCDPCGTYCVGSRLSRCSIAPFPK